MSQILAHELLKKDENFFHSQTKEELIGHVLILRQYLNELENKEEASSSNLAGTKRPATEIVSTERDAKAVANDLRSIIHKQIKAQMKWKPTCKVGSAQWKYDGMVPNNNVFNELMRSNVSYRRKKISVDEFERILGERFLVRIRYGYLRLRGDAVNVSWEPYSNTFSFSGKYGV